MSFTKTGSDDRVAGFVAVEKSPDHRVLQVVGPFTEVEDAARFANARQTGKRKDPYWIVATILKPE